MLYQIKYEDDVDAFLIVAILFFSALVFMGGIRFFSIYALFVNKAFSAIPRDWEYRPKVSVMISCFNEGRAVYETIKSISNSDYPQTKLEIIAFDDCSSDDSYEWMQKAAADFVGVTVKRNAKNQGKAMTLTDIFSASTARQLSALHRIRSTLQGIETALAKNTLRSLDLQSLSLEAMTKGAEARAQGFHALLLKLN